VSDLRLVSNFKDGGFEVDLGFRGWLAFRLTKLEFLCRIVLSDRVVFLLVSLCHHFTKAGGHFTLGGKDFSTKKEEKGVIVVLQTSLATDT
jgi:hypothetical protein